MYKKTIHHSYGVMETQIYVFNTNKQCVEVKEDIFLHNNMK